jgi:hypothetical protein
MEANATVSTGHSQGNIPQARLESLKRAVSGQSFSNFPAIFKGFAAKGIPESEIKPRENVVKVVTFIDCQSKETDVDTGERKISRRPWTTTVFHISQTELLKGGGL